MKGLTRRQKKKLISIIACAVLFAAVTLILRISDTVSSAPRAVILIMYLIPYLVIGRSVLYKAFRNIINGQVFDENFLMTLATAVAMIIGEYPEGVAVMLFYQVGELFESIAVGKSRGSISSLMELRPDTVNVVRGSEICEVAAEEVQEGEIIQVNVGERVPIDGEIVSGETTLDCAALTGEAMPVSARLGDKIPSGAINLSGVIRVKTLCGFEQSTVAKILALVETASEKKSRSEAFITRFAKYYTPAVVLAALALAIIPSLVVGNAATWIHRALIFLVISCPCALVISVPISFFGGIGAASKQGILIKGSCYLEQLSKVKTVVFDKTGTLTKGCFTVTGIHVSSDSYSENDILKLAAYAESYSSHPIALSIVSAYGNDIDGSLIGSVEELAGKGVKAQIGGKTILAGNSSLMEEISADGIPQGVGGTTVHVAVDGEYAGYITISDEIKPDSEQAISGLKAIGVRTVMLTGDEQTTAEAVACRLGIDQYHAKLMPADKVSQIEKLLGGDGAVAFIGDGINDAPVLTRADIGIAMGALGSDAAIEAADIVLMDDKPSKLTSAIDLSHRTIRIVYENIIFALSVKFLILILGALGIAGMWWAVFADVGVSVIAILNAMRTLAANRRG